MLLNNIPLYACSTLCLSIPKLFGQFGLFARVGTVNNAAMNVQGFVWTYVFICLGYKIMLGDFPGGAVVKNLSANAGDTGSSPGLGISHIPQSN